MIERVKKQDLHSQGLDPAEKLPKKTLLNRTFHQVLNESITEGPPNLYKKPVDTTNQTPVLPRGDSQSLYDKIIHIVFRHEGKTLVKDDAGRETSKFGILESTARQYGYKGEMSEMTKKDAEDIYKKLWEKSGAGDLPYPLSLVHFDTFVNSPAAAKRFLKQSGGDVDTYLDLRQKRYDRLVELRPERFAKYQKGWTNRINNLKALVLEERSNNSSIAKNTNADLHVTLHNYMDKGRLLF